MTLSCQEKFVSDDINKEYENGGEEVDIETDDDSYTITATESKKKKKKSSRAVGSSSHKFHQLIHYLYTWLWSHQHSLIMQNIWFGPIHSRT